MTYKFTLDKEVSIIVGISEKVSHKYFKLVDGTLTINKGYSWDGMSFYPDDDTTYLASLYHDCLYQIIRLKLIDHKYKAVADKLLYDTLIKNGHPKIKALICYIAVTLLGNLFLN